MRPAPAEPRIAHKGAGFLVIDKPAGWATEGGTPDLHAWLKAKNPYAALVHRLDQAASGLLVVSIRKEDNAWLAAVFREGTADRRYAAMLEGLVAPTTWDRPLSPPAGGKALPARTFVEVEAHGEGKTAVVCTLDTGRTHQIRLHAALAGHPILGDRRHGGEAGLRWPRLALHAITLSLPTPSGPRTWTSPIPDDLAALWASCTSPR